ncbi:hypothetical protein V8C37DRAFT_266323 [Trichoderma ceciliae]
MFPNQDEKTTPKIDLRVCEKEERTPKASVLRKIKDQTRMHEMRQTRCFCHMADDSLLSIELDKGDDSTMSGLVPGTRSPSSVSNLSLHLQQYLARHLEKQRFCWRKGNAPRLLTSFGSLWTYEHSVQQIQIWNGAWFIQTVNPTARASSLDSTSRVKAENRCIRSNMQICNFHFSLISQIKHQARKEQQRSHILLSEVEGRIASYSS